MAPVCGKQLLLLRSSVYRGSSLLFQEMNCLCDCFSISLPLGQLQSIFEGRHGVSVFSSVQTMLWLPILGEFNVHTDVNACDCTQGLYKLHWKLTLGEKFLAPVKFTAASIYSPGRTLCMCLWWSFWELWDFVFKWQKKNTLFGRGCASTKRMTDAELWTKHPQ